MNDLEITRKPCPVCNQEIVITNANTLARHRLPAPRHNGKLIFNNGRAALGKWCRGEKS